MMCEFGYIVEVASLLSFPRDSVPLPAILEGRNSLQEERDNLIAGNHRVPALNWWLSGERKPVLRSCGLGTKLHTVPLDGEAQPPLSLMQYPEIRV
jgi:hypothetical protein